MNSSDVAAILETHQEQYDLDCDIHNGCSCEWEPTKANSYYSDDPDFDARVEWRAHLLSALMSATS